MSILKSLLLSLSLLFSTTSLKAAERYLFDQSHTDIYWFASHFGFSKSSGKFTAFDGYIDINQQQPELSRVAITIETASVNTGLKKFDEHLISDDFFASSEYPTASFISHEIEIIDHQTAKIHGKFTLLGKTKPLTLLAVKNQIGVNPYNQKTTAGFTVTGSFKRSAYGMNFGLPGIGDEIELLIEAEAIKESS